MLKIRNRVAQAVVGLSRGKGLLRDRAGSDGDVVQPGARRRSGPGTHRRSGDAAGSLPFARRLAVILAAVLCVASPSVEARALSLDAGAGGVMVVRDDRGGLVAPRVQEIHALNDRGTRVEIRGRHCMSSCTLYLAARSLCVDPQTVFYFHGPSNGGTPLPAVQFEAWSRVMASHYRPALAEWFLHEGRITQGRDMHQITGANIIALGYPSC